ncbi:hypothetical protein IEQ34_005736 [Dendrobium chrysotoxum]|uniref:Ubiquitin-like protease family profile domain-containing protein n=1 Tax=Dendrobium chrysotoxum TaxID=161865 RepID=A0AAV7HDW6_DENCH|nr:hypothetical protein IEQ34_005736 [Dendrobium chrysotoxum]
MSIILYINHINQDSVGGSNLLLLLVIDNQHWTLLVGLLKEQIWQFFDSFSKPTHKAILPNIMSMTYSINYLYEEIEGLFDSDIRQWPIKTVTSIPT